MTGSVDSAEWHSVRWLAVMSPSAARRSSSGRATFDALALGDEAAAALGVDVERASRRAYLTAALVAAATVAAAGLVGFVGPGGPDTLCVRPDCVGTGLS